MLTCAIRFADVDLNELVSKPGTGEKSLCHRGITLSRMANIEAKGGIGLIGEQITGCGLGDRTFTALVLGRIQELFLFGR